MNKKIIPTILMSSLLLSGCSEKSDCDLPNRHVHLYTKNINNDIVISKYMDNEKLKVGNYDWNSNYIEITKEDEKIYKLLKNKFNGLDNFDYLYYLMENNKDYLEFYYEYYTNEIYYTTDGKGNMQMHTRLVHHDGWTEDPYYSNNTGRTRLNHYRYYGYRIVNKNNNYVLDKSHLVDDVRDIIFDYSFYDEKPYSIVSKEFEFNYYELPNLNVNDFYNEFEHPNLENKSLKLTH